MSRVFMTDGAASAGTGRTTATGSQAPSQQEAKSSHPPSDHDSQHSSRRISHVAAPPPDDLVTSKPGGPAAREKRTLKRVATRLTTIFSLRNLGRKAPEPRPARLENTYKMAPDDHVGFHPSAVEQEMTEILAAELAGMKYEEEQCKELALELADHIKQHVKDMGFLRHKIVCNVMMGQTQEQGMEMCSRALWDPRFDSWVCARYRNDHLFAVAILHACFVE